MKRIFFKTASGKIIWLFLAFVVITFLGGGFILSGLLRLPVPVANGLIAIVILIISRNVYKREGSDLSKLGLDLRWNHIKYIIPGLIAGGLFVVPLVYAFCYIKGYPVVFNQNFSAYYVLSGLITGLPVVVLEELAFRGICFEKTIALAGVRKANIIFAILFVISHWLNMPEFKLLQMAVLLITALGHLLYATAFLKSGTLYFSIALHAGNNWVSNFVFSTPENPGNHSLIHIVTGYQSQVADAGFFLTTLTTAIFFTLFILILRRWRDGSTSIKRNILE
jgi:membrane protease YdiL (CAAX protease family)